MSPDLITGRVGGPTFKQIDKMNFVLCTVELIMIWLAKNQKNKVQFEEEVMKVMK